jgi:predicted  nucleic acid-binding Zn-ribbon protein
MSNLQLNLISQDIILELGTVGPPGPPGGSIDQPARDAIGWPYTDPNTISSRLVTLNTEIDNIIADVNAGFTDIHNVIGWPYVDPYNISTRLTAFDILAVQTKTAINGLTWPYTNPLSLDARVTALETTGGVDVAARSAIGWPYTNPINLNLRVSTAETNISTLQTESNDYESRITVIENDLPTINTNISGLQTAVGIPYVNANNLSTRVTTLEGKTDLSVVGTSGQITVNTVNSVATVSIPNPFIVPGNATIIGNANVQGTLTYTNVNDLNITNNTINLNYGYVGTPALNAFINIVRGDQPDVALLWNESAGRWQVGSTATPASWVNLLIPSDLDTINSTLTSYGTRITTNETNITKLQQDVTTVQTAVNGLQINVTALQSEVANNTSDITDLKGRTTTLETRMTTAEGNIVQLQSDVSTIKGQITTIQGNITTINAEILTINSEIATINQAISNLPTKFTANIGNGVDTDYVVTHNKNTLAIISQVFDNNTGEAVYPDIIRSSVNTVTIRFGSVPSSNAYSVVIY